MAACFPDRSFWMGRSVLVTGHTGFKGAWLALWLTHLGARVTGFALPPQTTPSLYGLSGLAGRLMEHDGDVNDLRSLKNCLQKSQPQIIFHLAAQALVRSSYADPVGTYATNIMGTVHLLEAVRSCPSVAAVVIVTSDKAYENREWYWAYREDEPMGGRDPYSSSKGCAELVTSAYRASFFSDGEHSARIASARAGNVIGGGDWSTDRLIPDVVRSFSRGEAVEIRAPAAVRPWQHVLEPLSGYLRLAELLATLEGAGFAEGWNFGPADEDCQPVADIVATLASLWQNGAEWRLSADPQPHEATFLKVDASKARARLGWKPRLRLPEALVWTAEWYRRQADGHEAAALCLKQIAHYECLGSEGVQI